MYLRRKLLRHNFNILDMKKLLKLISFAAVSVLILTSCEGPMGMQGPVGPAGPVGPQGPMGKDATCMPCHKPTSVKAIEREFLRFSAHSITPLRTGGGGACAVCHTQEGFIYAVENNVNSIPTAVNSNISELFNCYTCHSAIHTDFEWTLTTVAPVPLAMWNGEKTANLTAGGSSSNLCLKCHQPRGITGINNIVSSPNAPNTNLGTTPAYNGGIHYNTGQILYAGVGGIEFGNGYTNTRHLTVSGGVSCARCHMADTDGPAEGHTFTATIKGCTVSCHGRDESALIARMEPIKAELEQLLADLAAKLKTVVGGGNDVVTPTGNINTWHATGNPNGYWRNPDKGNINFPALTNAQYGAIINYQLVARSAGAKSGVHNYPYVKKLLENSIAAI
jgi:formate-dependent nitrite reductase cytochrome c552 subunit